MKLLKHCLHGILSLSIGIAYADTQIDSLHPTELICEERFQNCTYLHYKSSPFGSESEGDIGANSGYRALYNGLVSLKLSTVREDEKIELLKNMNTQRASSELFGRENSLWRSTVIEHRRKTSVAGYILSKYVSCLLTQSFPERQDGNQIKKEIMRLIPYASLNIAQKHTAAVFTITPQELSLAFTQAAHEKKGSSDKPFDTSLVEKYFTELQPFTAELRVGINCHEIYEGEERMHKVTYGPLEHTRSALDGSWLSSFELRHLVDQELENPSVHLAALLERDVSIHFLEFKEDTTHSEMLWNLHEINWLQRELENKAHYFKALYLIQCGNEWISYLITKSENGVTFIVTDPQNKDRREEEGVIALTKIVQEAASPEKRSPDIVSAGEHIEHDKGHSDASPKSNHKQGIFSRTHQEPEIKPHELLSQQGAKAARNYDAPLAHVPDSEIPSLEELFGSKIPNSILVLIKQMKKKETGSSSSTKLKNCLLLYGPPGTGKSTIAQVMARAAGKNIMYAGGGDFRTAMQGSGTEMLEALFAEAKKRGNCVIIIDEIDGASTRLQPHSSTQEDNRALKKLITSLDQFRYDPDIFVICTTNYAEDIDPAVLRRLKCVEIGLPDYAKRKNIIDYYFRKNNIAVASRTPDAVSPDFYNKLISATVGFSGDALGEMVNTALFEFKEELEPEFHINLDFRTKGIDLYNKSIIANLGELALLPLTPFFMMIGESALDKQLYSAYMRQVKLYEDLKKKEHKKDPLDKYAKDPLLTRFIRRNYDHASSAVEQSFWNMFIQAGWKTVFKKAGLSL